MNKLITIIAYIVFIPLIVLLGSINGFARENRPAKRRK